jgi:hypothetical protein
MTAVEKIRASALMVRNTTYAMRMSYCAFLLLILAACGPTVPPTLFIPPSSPKITPSPVVSISFATPIPTISRPTATTAVATPTPSIETQTVEPANLTLIPETQTVEPAASPASDCLSALRYLQDLNYPDGSVVSPGQSVEKQWRVENNGSCDWDERYKLKLLEGFPQLGANPEQALYPARAGFQATLTINFTAPMEAGTYRTSWQGVDPQGKPFGDAIFMEIVVQP